MHFVARCTDILVDLYWFVKGFRYHEGRKFKLILQMEISHRNPHVPSITVDAPGKDWRSMANTGMPKTQCQGEPVSWSTWRISHGAFLKRHISSCKHWCLQTHFTGYSCDHYGLWINKHDKKMGDPGISHSHIQNYLHSLYMMHPGPGPTALAHCHTPQATPHHQ